MNQQYEVQLLFVMLILTVLREVLHNGYKTGYT